MYLPHGCHPRCSHLKHSKSNSYDNSSRWPYLGARQYSSRSIALTFSALLTSLLTSLVFLIASQRLTNTYFKIAVQNCSQLLTSSLVLPLCPAPWATLLLGFSYYCTAPCDTWPIPFWPFFLYSSRSPACSFLFWSPLLVIYHRYSWYYSLPVTSPCDSDHRSLWPPRLLVELFLDFSRHSSLWLWPRLLVATTAPCGIILFGPHV